MREIKFRAWEKNLKEIIPVHFIDFANRMINAKSAWRLFDEIELMQYTGLKDKNGKEIYEGDIVKNLRDKTFEIFWSEEELAWCDKGKWRDGRDNITLLADLNAVATIEVIGNIYENPELLEVAE
jgi:uncharacterized phage protein (TIGR01671 family)